MPLMGTKHLGLSVSTFRSLFVFRHLHEWQKTKGIGHRTYTDTLLINPVFVRDPGTGYIAKQKEIEDIAWP